jgi:PKHD-type hydroxylase
MQFFLTPRAKNIPPYVWWDGAFTEDELNWLQSQAKNSTQPAAVGSEGPTVDISVRRSRVSWLTNTPNTSWIYDKLAHIVTELNTQFYNFDITGFGDALQLTTYDHLDHGTYGWHQDYNSRTISRKLSLTVQLTDPSEYDGGELQIFTSKIPDSVPKQRGLVAVFPSYVMHQVTPVTRGSRQSLVTWISGPAFK